MDNKAEYKVALSVFLSLFHACFPFLADVSHDIALDAHELIITHPVAANFVRVAGESMINAAVWERDVFVVDKAIEPSDGSIIVASLNGAFTVKKAPLSAR